MNGMTAFACISDVELDLIEESMEVFGERGTVAVSARRGRSGLARFFSSGWGVAVICAAVSLSVLGGIVWMGQRPAVDPPFGDTAESESEDAVYESESFDVNTETEEETESAGEEGTESVSEAVTEEHTEELTEEVTAGVCHPDVAEGGVLFISNGDGTCKVKGADKAYQGVIIVPERSPYGDVVTVVMRGAFKGFSSVKAVELPETVTVIKGSAFQGCSALERVKLPSEVTEFGSAMFDLCGELESVELPAGLTEIPAMTFQTCVNLRSVTVQDGITAIGANAFNGCRSLWTLTLPAGLKSIGSQAFLNCCGLASVYYGGSREEWEQVKINETGNARILNMNVKYTG